MVIHAPQQIISNLRLRHRVDFLLTAHFAAIFYSSLYAFACSFFSQVPSAHNYGSPPPEVKLNDIFALDNFYTQPVQLDPYASHEIVHVVDATANALPEPF